MRAACALCVFQGILLATSTVGAEQFPYKAYVNANNVYIRSGPGKNYYPTDKLQRGAEVEVYRHDPGGWYAVRPPADSYSWIPGGEVNVLEDNLAEVVQQDVVVYVGSKFSDV
ncbi:MAG: SH3 domain-containing protein, partial [Planctomycetales bacterium]|nr:SH3 domain-containing protein [Planctomycetales bacterium]